MNLVETVMKSLGGETLGSLAGLLGAGEQETKSALGAAVPALLGGIGSLASNKSGAEKLWGAVQGVDDSLVGNFASMLTGNQAEATSKMGSGLLNALFGQSAVGSLVSALGGFLGGKSSMISKLLPLLAPLILGQISKQVKSGGLDLAGLTKMLLGQKSNVASAMPVGLLDSLSKAQGLGDLTGFAQSASDTVASAGRAASSAAHATTEAASPMRWLLPLILLAAAAYGLYWMMNRAAPQNEVIEEVVTETIEDPVDLSLKTDFSDYFTNMGSVLNGVTDVDSAKAALPKLEDMNGKLDSLTAIFSNLPAAVKAGMTPTLETSVSQLQKERDRVQEIPGVGDILKSIFSTIFEKLTALIRG